LKIPYMDMVVRSLAQTLGVWPTDQLPAALLFYSG